VSANRIPSSLARYSTTQSDLDWNAFLVTQKRHVNTKYYS